MNMFGSRFAVVSFFTLVSCRLLTAQSQWAEVRIAVADAMGLALPSDVKLVSEATRTERITKTNNAGEFDFQHVPFGIYRLTVSHAGFAMYSSVLDLHSTQPRDVKVQLDIKSESTEVTVTDTPTVIDPYRTGVAYNVGAKQISEEQSNSPGRGLLELVDDQPGWLFEANGVLHPRGSEYDTLMVVDGVPMDENRSAAFAPGLQAAEVLARRAAFYPENTVGNEVPSPSVLRKVTRIGILIRRCWATIQIPERRME